MRSAKDGDSSKGGEIDTRQDREPETAKSSSHPREIPEPFRALLDLFRGPLADVRFPGVDHDTLTTACSAISQRAQEVEKARAVLDQTQRALDAELDEVRKLGRRALAYLEIYAEGNEHLLEAVAEVRTAIGAEAPSPSTKPAARRRKKKKSSSGPQLPLAPEAEETAADEAEAAA
ncbi:MAG: hypothetical protein AAFN74_06760 [Myxococcota bacterium]